MQGLRVFGVELARLRNRHVEAAGDNHPRITLAVVDGVQHGVQHVQACRAVIRMSLLALCQRDVLLEIVKHQQQRLLAVGVVFRLEQLAQALFQRLGSIVQQALCLGQYLADGCHQRGFIQPAVTHHRRIAVAQTVNQPRRRAAFAQTAHAVQQDAFRIRRVPLPRPQTAQTALQQTPPPDEAFPRTHRHAPACIQKLLRGVVLAHPDAPFAHQGFQRGGIHMAA